MMSCPHFLTLDLGIILQLPVSASSLYWELLKDKIFLFLYLRTVLGT